MTMPQFVGPHGYVHGWIKVAAEANALQQGDTDKTGSRGLLHVLKHTGFAGKPKVVSSGEFDKVSAGRDVLYRGIGGGQAAEHARSFREDAEPHVGFGVYGNGFYTSPDRQTAKDRSGGGGVVTRMMLDKDAKVIKHSELKSEITQHLMSEMAKAKTPQEQAALKAYMTDPSVYAALKGYDAVQVDDKGHNHMLVLNRSKLTVDGGEQHPEEHSAMTKRARVAPSMANAAAEVSDLNENGELPLYFPALAIEGMPTSDGRTIAPGSLGHRALPISVLAQFTNPGQQGGHAGAEVIGHLTEIWRKPGEECVSKETGQPFPKGTFVWQGRGVADPESTGGKLARAGHLRGNSVDLSEIDFTEEFGEDDKPSITITAGKIAATTLCPIPAFADAYVDISEDGEQVEPDGEPVLLAAGYASFELPAWRAAELGDECGLCALSSDEDDWTEVTSADGTATFSPTVAKRKRAFARGLAMKGDKPDGSDASYPIENQADLDKAVNMRGQGDADKSAVVAHIKKAARKLGLKLPDSLKASGEPQPPSYALFADPHLSVPSPISIGAARGDGRREITGHIATWSECHTSYSGTCVRPPHSRTDYARFMTGAMRVLDGDVPKVAAVGRISMSRNAQDGGHADGALSEAQAVAHYDNHCVAAADVAAGEDAHGIWIHGLTRGDLSEADVDKLLASPFSGDWRNHGGNLELCAVLAVNAPGYVVPRSRVASGEPQSLVAAGMLRPGAEFAPAGGLTLAAIRTVIDAALIAFFDPDNDGDIDRPMDDQSDDGTGEKPVKPTPPQSGQQQPDQEPKPKSMQERRSEALLAMRRIAALADGPFVRRSTETPV